jgi:hypothetical protein
VNTGDLVIFLVVVAARFLVPLLIPRFPLPAILAALVIDAADQTIFQLFTDIDTSETGSYQTYDKALDIYYLTIAYVSAVRNWTNGFALEAARFLWYYRLVGVVLFEATEARFLLFVFPNTFEYFFIAYEAIRTRWDPRRMSHRNTIIVAACIWIFVKLPQEYWIHIARLDFTDTVRRLANERPVLLWSLIGLVVAIAVALGVLSRRLPAADWKFRVDVDRPLPEVTIGAQATEAERAGPAMLWPRVEKIALIALVSAIFGQLLQVGASGVQILVATSIIVVVNAALSPAIVRNGPLDRRRIFVLFVVLAVTNTAIISVYAALVSDNGIYRGAAWFFGILLSLIISLYDRYRNVRLERLESVR